MTDHPSALVSVPPQALEAVAFNLCSLHDFDPAFVQQNERFAMAAITEYLRATPAPAAPQAAGAGEEQWLWRIPGRGWVLCDREGDVVREARVDGAWVATEVVALSALRAPSREPEGEGVEGWIVHDGTENPAPGQRVDVKLTFVTFTDIDADTFDWNGRCRWRRALATREEAPACKTCGGKGYTEHEGGEGEGYPSRPEIEACPSCEAPAEAGERQDAVVRVSAVAAGAQVDQVYGGEWCADPATAFRADLVKVLALRAQPPAREDGDEAYDLGKRDGYGQAVQDIDLLTGGDGEYVFATDGGGCPDPKAMKARIVDRFQAREDAQPVAWLLENHGSGTGPICRDHPGEWPNTTVYPLFKHPAPDALRVAVEALEPFATAFRGLSSRWEDHETHWQDATSPIAVEDLRRADKALAALQAEQGAK